jgi:hypothetical protein
MTLRDRADFTKLVPVLEGVRDWPRNREGGTQMKASRRSEVLRETDHGQEHLANPSVHTMQELPSDWQTPPHNLVGPHVPDESTSETFAGGAGI